MTQWSELVTTKVLVAITFTFTFLDDARAARWSGDGTPSAPYKRGRPTGQSNTIKATFTSKQLNKPNLLSTYTKHISIMGGVFSSIGHGISAVISAIANVFITIVNAITN
ncbi:hypothetical protein FRC18_005284, partial [Serendipita sp. 400]